MLKRVLQELAAGRTHSRASLARQLDISERLLAQMMEDLARKGYLAPLFESDGSGCPSGCGACKASCAGCFAHNQSLLQGWVLTAKGHSAIEVNHS